MPRRRSWTVREKLRIVAELSRGDVTLHSLSKKYKVPRRCLRLRRAQKAELQAMLDINPNAGSLHRGPSYDAGFECELRNWIIERRNEGIPVHTRDVIHKATSDRPNFHKGELKALQAWVYKFLIRQKLAVRRITHKGQKKWGHLDEVRKDVVTNIRQRFEEGDMYHGMELHYMVNMDETAIYFEDKHHSSIDVQGTNTVACRDSSSSSKRCTVCIAVAGDGTKLPPFVIFKGQKGARIASSLSGLSATVQAKGWIDSETMIEWIENLDTIPWRLLWAIIIAA